MVVLFQYGSDEFGHDSPRYTSPGTYYVTDGSSAVSGGEVWPGATAAGPYGAAAASYQPYDPYSLPPEPGPECQGLPPMSSFRANGAPTPGAAPNQYSAQDSIGKALGAVSTHYTSLGKITVLSI